jgi:hypothetical protein
MSWRYEIRGSENRLVEIRSGFATDKEARDAAQRSKRMIDCICYPNPETLTLVTKQNGTAPNRVPEKSAVPEGQLDPSRAAQHEAIFKYPWQQAVLDAFLESHPENLPGKLNVAERAISARLLESDPFELEERVALGEALLALRRLVREHSEGREESRQNKGIA